MDKQPRGFNDGAETGKELHIFEYVASFLLSKIISGVLLGANSFIHCLFEEGNSDFYFYRMLFHPVVPASNIK